MEKSTQKLLLYYLIIIASSLLGLCADSLFKYDTYEYKLTANIAQYLIIYIPTLLLLSNSLHIEEFIEYFKNAFVFLAKLNCIWGIVQFVVWILFRIDFNDLVFNTYLNGILGDSWSVYDQTISGGSLIRNLRIAGLNYEPACFSFILLLGYVFDEKRWHKPVYLLTIVLSLSRAGIVVALLIFAKDIIKNIKKININTIITAVVGIVVMIGVLYAILHSSLGSGLQNQINVLMNRFSFVSVAESGSGTYRHMMYIGWAIREWLLSLNPLQKLIGIGFRVSGVAFSESSFVSNYLQDIMSSQAWAIECDFADILLGTGIIGALLVYSFLAQVYKLGDSFCKNTVFVIITFGLLYNVSIWTFTSLVYLFLMIASNTSKYTLVNSSLDTD